MDWNVWKPTRRGLLLRQLPVLACLGIAGRPHEAAAAKLQKADVAYRDKPKEGKSCATCRQFSAVTSAAGTCAIVDGEVSASGWCTVYSPRPLALRRSPDATIAQAHSARWQARRVPTAD